MSIWKTKGKINICFNYLVINYLFSFDSPFTNLSRVLAGYFMQMFDCHEPDKAALASTAFCRVMWPTFELQKDSVVNAK